MFNTKLEVQYVLFDSTLA